MLAAAEAFFDRAVTVEFAGFDASQHATTDRQHGRREDCNVTVIRNPEGLPEIWATTKRSCRRSASVR